MRQHYNEQNASSKLRREGVLRRWPNTHGVSGAMRQAVLSKFEKEKQLLIEELTKNAFEEFKKGMQKVAAGILLDAESFISTTDYRDQVVFSLRIPKPVEPTNVTKSDDTKEEGE